MGNGKAIGGVSGRSGDDGNGRTYQHLFRIAITVADRLLNGCDRAFLEYLSGARGAEVFRRYGFKGN